MGLFDLFEKLINEHGSATVLRERLDLIKAQYAAMERENQNLQAQNAALKAELQQLQAAAPAPYHCDSCGSARLVRTGNRPDPTFGDLGIKQAVFRCDDCGATSAFTP